MVSARPVVLELLMGKNAQISQICGATVQTTSSLVINELLSQTNFSLGFIFLHVCVLTSFLSLNFIVPQHTPHCPHDSKALTSLRMPSLLSI